MRTCIQVSLLLVVVLMSTLGCGPAPRRDKNENRLPPEIFKPLAEVAEVQSQGLENATTVIHRAFDYQENVRGLPAGHKMVAVDVSKVPERL